MLFLIGMVTCLLSQTHLLQRAMMTGDNMSVIPTFQAFWTVWGVVGGVVFYRQGSVNLIGLLFVLVGVVFLMQHARKKAKRALASQNVGSDIELDDVESGSREHGGEHRYRMAHSDSTHTRDRTSSGL